MEFDAKPTSRGLAICNGGVMGASIIVACLDLYRMSYMAVTLRVVEWARMILSTKESLMGPFGTLMIVR